HAATSWPKPPQVLEAWARFHREVAGSPGRGAHAGSLEATRRVERVRRELTDLLGGADARRCVFTPSCTHAMNLAFHGALRPGDHAIATALDHNAALRPLAAMEAEGRIALTIVDASRDGFVSPDAIRAAVRPATRLVVATHAGNAFGTIQDVAAFAEIAHAAGARVLLDAAQSAGVIPIDARALGADLVAVPSHKSLLGPAGAGALLVAPDVDLAPDRFGGTGMDSTSLTPPVAWPASFEPGTGNAAGVVAWGEGIRVATEDGLAAVAAHERSLLARLEAGLAAIPRVTRYATRDLERRVGVLSCSVEGHDPAEVAAILDASFGIAVRAGVLCAPRAAAAVGAPASGFVRISVGRTTTPADVDAAIDALRAIAEA
ncbi:MAG TPA: aminotransferase class V-fold PLP-dependent enzyme, partial [Planctomycetota bacterium]|nr:aminotransferase class V-fold PLP-dependent enzyme [Planctomycetota bacterium]